MRWGGGGGGGGGGGVDFQVLLFLMCVISHRKVSLGNLKVELLCV